MSAGIVPAVTIDAAVVCCHVRTSTTGIPALPAASAALNHCTTFTCRIPALPAEFVWLKYMTSTGIAPAVVMAATALPPHELTSTLPAIAPGAPGMALTAAPAHEIGRAHV